MKNNFTDRMFCESLFLGPEEDLDAIIETDRETLRNAGITHDQIADLLESVAVLCKREANPVRAITEYPVKSVTHPLTVKVAMDDHAYLGTTFNKQDSTYGLKAKECAHFLGHQDCPFGSLPECLTMRDGDADITLTKILPNGAQEETFFFGTLMPHLVRRHQFFEGPVVKYRLDPGRVVSFFDLKPGVDYKDWFQKDDCIVKRFVDTVPLRLRRYVNMSKGMCHSYV